MLIALWETAAFLIDDRLILPSFSQVVFAFMENWRSILLDDLPVSALHFAIGMAGGLLIALPIGMIMGWFKFLDSIFDPIVRYCAPYRHWPGSHLPSSGLALPILQQDLSYSSGLCFPY
jgi:NitT/TauT family transport system permease protein